MFRDAFWWQSTTFPHRRHVPKSGLARRSTRPRLRRTPPHSKWYMDVPAARTRWKAAAPGAPATLAAMTARMSIKRRFLNMAATSAFSWALPSKHRERV